MKVIKNRTEVGALVGTILDSADKTREKLQNMSAEDLLSTGNSVFRVPSGIIPLKMMIWASRSSKA